MQVYDNDFLRYQNSGTGVNWPVAMTPGSHDVVVQAWDVAGNVVKQHVAVNVLAVPVTISKPLNNARVSSPVAIQASVPPNSHVYSMQVYVDDVLKYQVSGSVVSTSLAMSSGLHHIVAQAWDTGGGIWKSEVYITVQ